MISKEKFIKNFSLKELSSSPSRMCVIKVHEGGKCGKKPRNAEFISVPGLFVSGYFEKLLLNSEKLLQFYGLYCICPWKADKLAKLEKMEEVWNFRRKGEESPSYQLYP